MKKYLTIYEKLFEWLHERLTPKQFLLLSAALVGISAGIAVVVLKAFVYYIHLGITYNYNIPFQYYLYLIFPLVGILLTVWYVQKFKRGRLEKGNAQILYAIAKKGGLMKKDSMYTHVITSSVTVGFGGSAGLESPIVITGSAIGSNYGRTYHVSKKDRTLLLASGAAAGIAAAFNAPIAGVLFALEVLLVDATITAFIPILIAAASGAIISKIILGEEILLSFILHESFNYKNLPFYIGLGLAAGIVSVYYARAFMRTERLFKPLREKIYARAVYGGILLACLILIFPTFFGEGYESIMQLAKGDPQEVMNKSLFSDYSDNVWVVWLFVGLCMLFKVFATAFTLGAGGNGGNFAPSMFVGAYLGFFFAYGINLLKIAVLPVSNFTIVAMAGIISGIFHAPLTAIFLIAEITGGYELMIPLMIVSALSYAVVKYFEPFPMDTKRLAQRGHILTHDRDKNILLAMKTEKLIETDFHPLYPELNLGELVKIISSTNKNTYPVVNKKGELQGILQLDDVREIMFKQELYETTFVRDLMQPTPAFIIPEEEMNVVMKKFDETKAWSLPVIDNGRFIGFIKKSSIYTYYRNFLVKSTRE